MTLLTSLLSLISFIGVMIHLLSKNIKTKTNMCLYVGITELILSGLYCYQHNKFDTIFSLVISVVWILLYRNYRKT